MLLKSFSSFLKSTAQWELPLKNHRDSSDWVFLQTLDDLRCFVTVDAIDGPALDHLRGSSQTIIQAKFLLVLLAQAGQFFLHALQHTDCG